MRECCHSGWYEDYWMDRNEYCEECRETNKRRKEALDFFEGICELLSYEKSYDPALFFNYLEELGACLDSKYDMRKIDFQGKICA